MDPNACLAEIRAMLADWGRGTDIDSDHFVELVIDLDEWLSKKGALPSVWTSFTPDLEQ